MMVPLQMLRFQGALAEQGYAAVFHASGEDVPLREDRVPGAYPVEVQQVQPGRSRRVLRPDPQGRAQPDRQQVSGRGLDVHLVFQASVQAQEVFPYRGWAVQDLQQAPPCAV